MSDIVEMLRADARFMRGEPDCVGPHVTLLSERAADEIEALRAEVEKLRAALVAVRNRRGEEPTPMSDPLFDYDADPITKWQRIGRENGWTMPRAPHWMVRLPIVRHVWVLKQAWLVDRHYSRGLGSIGLRTGYDEWALWGMWRNLWPKEGAYANE